MSIVGVYPYRYTYAISPVYKQYPLSSSRVQLRTRSCCPVCTVPRPRTLRWLLWEEKGWHMGTTATRGRKLQRESLKQDLLERGFASINSCRHHHRHHRHHHYCPSFFTLSSQLPLFLLLMSLLSLLVFLLSSLSLLLHYHHNYCSYYHNYRNPDSSSYRSPHRRCCCSRSCVFRTIVRSLEPFMFALLYVYRTQ